MKGWTNFMPAQKGAQGPSDLQDGGRRGGELPAWVHIQPLPRSKLLRLRLLK